MALVWADGFDHYGTLANMTQGGYQSVSGIGYYSDVTKARTGPGVVLVNQYTGMVRKVLSSPQRTVGSGVGFKLTNAGKTINPYWGREAGILFESAINTIGMAVVFNENLGLTVWDNGTATGNPSGTIVGVSAPNLYNLGSYYWLEMRVTFNSGTNTNDASCEVRLQGQPVIIITGLNVNGTVNSVIIGQNNSFACNAIVYYDDWVIWDSTGAKNNSFLGDRRCVTSYPISNGVSQAWTATAAPAYARIANLPPDDAQYVSAANVGDVSEFGKQAVSVAATDVAAVVTFARAWKTDAGTSTFSMGINSNAIVLNSPELLPGTTPTYFNNIFELDPNGGIAWTKAAVDAALLRITRVS